MAHSLTLAEDLAQCIGTENQYQHWLLRSFRYTDGIKTLADGAGAYWLVDLVASHQPEPKLRGADFQLWRLRKLPEGSKNAAVAECLTDTNGQVLCRQFIPYTDFPFVELGDTFEWYVCDRVMMLKSEY